MLSLLNISFRRYGSLRVLKLNRLTFTMTVSRSLAAQRTNKQRRDWLRLCATDFRITLKLWQRAYTYQQQAKAIAQLERKAGISRNSLFERG